MKKTFIFLLCLCLLYKTQSQTIIQGGAVSGTWTKSGSPYLIQGAIMIGNGTSLTIEPGVKVEFQGHFILLVKGRILAVGAKSDSIEFNASDTINGWAGIRFDNVYYFSDTSKFYFCKIRNSKAFGDYPNGYGGAFFVKDFSKLIISDCSILNCTADISGGAIFCNHSFPIIKNNKISGNSALGGHGGAITCMGCKIINNTISYNSSSGHGGGIFDSSSGFTNVYEPSEIFQNSIFNNTALNGNGGGISTIEYSSTISSNFIYNNTAANEGGGIIVEAGNSACKIIKNFICNNSANNGGGLYVNGSTNLGLSNNVIANNKANYFGGGVTFENSSSGTGINNTITNNYAPKGGAIYCTVNSSPTSVNTVIWGNTESIIDKQIFINDQTCEPNFYFCDIKGGETSIGTTQNVFYLGNYSNNINENPLFINPSNGSGNNYNGIFANWSLQANSPCINAGDTTYLVAATDIIGNPRIFEEIIDIGAYESQIPVSIMKENIEQSIKIFPNPFSIQTTVYNSFVSSNYDVILYNHLGQIVKQIYKIVGNSFVLKRENLPSGLYYIRISQCNKIVFRDKIIITNK